MKPFSVDIIQSNCTSIQTTHKHEPSLSADAETQETERKARVDAVWEEMNRGVPNQTTKCLSKHIPVGSKTRPKAVPGWMVSLGLTPGSPNNGQAISQKRLKIEENDTDEEVKKLAAAALSAVQDACSVPSNKGKAEVMQIRDFSREDIQSKKLVDIDPKDSFEKAKGTASQLTGLDAVLEQIKKKQKLSVLGKTKKDWGEFKEEHKGMEDELDAYKKSSNQYIEKVSFLQRTDLREFEREKEARLAMQARRGKPDMHER